MRCAWRRCRRICAAANICSTSFSIADAYLTTILNWAGATQVDLKQWPEVNEYYQRMLKRPSIARAAGEEFAMYKEEQARKQRA